MSSAIEVLKDMLESKEMFQQFCVWESTNERLEALKKALLALEKQENYVIDFIRLEVLPKSKKEQFRVFFKDGTEQVFEKERVGEQK